MKKIGIITCGKESNYGACLQAFAMQKKIQELGYETELMNYSLVGDKSYSPFKQLTLKSFIASFIFYFPRKAQWSSFGRFRNDHMTYSSKRLYCAEDFNIVKSDYSCFVTGSDQVWNPELGIDINITLQTFIKAHDHIRKISYASSFGLKELPEEYYTIYRDSLNKFDAISVRENSGCKIVNELAPDKKCQMVCDPVMLYDASFWKTLKDDTKSPRERYILIYDMRHSVEVMNCALRLAKERNCNVIAISRVKLFKKGICCMTNLSPSQFLSYIYDAEAIVTDSFHGTVFSIIFHKEFYSFCSANGLRIGDRLVNILEKIGLSDRIYEKFDDSVKFSNINYIYVDQIVNDFRLSSIEYLTNALIGNE